MIESCFIPAVSGAVRTRQSETAVALPRLNLVTIANKRQPVVRAPGRLPEQSDWPFFHRPNWPRRWNRTGSQIPLSIHQSLDSQPCGVPLQSLLSPH